MIWCFPANHSSKEHSQTASHTSTALDLKHSFFLFYDLWTSTDRALGQNKQADMHASIFHSIYLYIHKFHYIC